jgi:hypothetical protein
MKACRSVPGVPITTYQSWSRSAFARASLLPVKRRPRGLAESQYRIPIAAREKSLTPSKRKSFIACSTSPGTEKVDGVMNELK